MSTPPVKLLLDKVFTGNRKLDRFLKKHLKKTMTFHQLDQSAFNLYFYLKHNGLNVTDVRFTVRLVFESAYLPVMSVNLTAYPSGELKRLSRLCFEEVEAKFLRDYTQKNTHEKSVVDKDIRAVFQAFLHSGFLLKHDDVIFAMATLASRKKKVNKSQRLLLSKQERKILTGFYRLKEKEEVLNVG